jgi:hypothetical protein
MKQQINNHHLIPIFNNNPYFYNGLTITDVQPIGQNLIKDYVKDVHKPWVVHR